MKKLTVLMICGALILLAAVIGVSAMPDEGNGGGRAAGAGSLIQHVRDEGTGLDCLSDQNVARLTREELKELHNELGLYGADDPATAAVATCILRINVATK